MMLTKQIMTEGEYDTERAKVVTIDDLRALFQRCGWRQTDIAVREGHSQSWVNDVLWGKITHLHGGKSISRAQPWVAEGVSRRTWYRRRAVAQVRPSICLRECADGLVPPSTRPDRLTARAVPDRQPRGLSDDTHVIDPSTSRCMPCSS
jgi:hypothetical protein